MDIALVAPELREPMKRAQAPNTERFLIRKFVRGAVAVMPAKKVQGVDLERRKVGRGVRLYRPRKVKSDGALFFVHGGGLVMGGAVINDRMCGEFRVGQVSLRRVERSLRHPSRRN